MGLINTGWEQFGTGWERYAPGGIHMYWMGVICTGWDPYVLDGSDMILDGSLIFSVNDRTLLYHI